MPLRSRLAKLVSRFRSRRPLFWIVFGACALFAMGVLFVVAANVWIVMAGSARVHDSIDGLPDNRVGIVLGCSKYTRAGRVNAYYRHRLLSAAELYRTGKVRYLLVSGDNSTRQYNEPTTMKKDLIAEGIPAEAIYLDYAGFRTLDSMVRANRVFGLDRFTIVSQEYHNYRAVFIARRNGLDAVAYCADPPHMPRSLKTEAREYIARAWCVLDVYVFRTKPKFLGPKVLIPS